MHSATLQHKQVKSDQANHAVIGNKKTEQKPGRQQGLFASLTRQIYGNGTADDPGQTPPIFHDFSKIPILSSSPIRIQPKLSINTPGDKYEQEADRVAEQVMRMPAPKLQRKCAQCEEEEKTSLRRKDNGNFLNTNTSPTIQRKCAKCEEEDKKILQRKEAPQAVSAETSASSAPPIVHEVLNSAGEPLDESTRTFMESRFGQDFSHVRVHTDSKAAESAKAVQALAYTVSKNIVFGFGQFNPRTNAGRRLLAHELTHAIQQDGVVGNLKRGSPTEYDSQFKQEAHYPANQIENGKNVNVQLRAYSKEIQRFWVTEEAAGGCGICYDIQFPKKGPQNAGRVAHTVVQNAFLGALHLLGKDRLVEFPFSAPEDGNGRLDLAIETPISANRKAFAIGEIKPATPNGEKEGIKDLDWYKTAILAAYPGSTVEPLVTRIPVAEGLPMPDALATIAGCAQQLLGVVMMRPGLYGYFCTPPFSQARSTCSCRPPSKVKKEKEKEKNRAKPHIPPVLVPQLAFEALFAAALAWTAKKSAGRGAPAMVLLAIVLVANGAEASVGLEGDDAIDAMIKMAEQKGATVPDDLKDAIKKDPALRKILIEAAKTGDKTEAQRQLGEQLTRVIVENRDQFTEEELKELLITTETHQGQIPNGKVTVEEIKRALESKKKGGGGTSSGSGAAGGVGTGAKKEETSGDKPSQPDQAASPKKPEERLVEGLVRHEGEGPKVTAKLKEKLLATARAVVPPLTDIEVDELLKRIGSAEGKSEEEIVESVRQGVNALRTRKGGAPTGKDATDPNAISDTPDKPQFEKNGFNLRIDKTDPNKSATNDEKKIIEAYNKWIAKMDWIESGNSYLHVTDLAYEIGKTYSMILLGRDKEGILFVGQVRVKINKKNISFYDVTIASGAILYTKDRRYGTLRVSNGFFKYPSPNSLQ